MPHISSRGSVTLECARLLQAAPHGPPCELFQIIGQDSCVNARPAVIFCNILHMYQGAVRKSNGAVLNKLLQPPRCLIVTPREGLCEQPASSSSNSSSSSSAEIVVPPEHSSRVCVLLGYKDDMVLRHPPPPP